jgi:RNA polymerase sigma factor (sigma-70 family)
VDEHEMIFSSETNIEDEVISTYIAQDIYEAIDKLPEHHRSVVVLRYIEDFSYNEIAESLSLPINTVKSYLFRARKQLQIILQEYQKGGVRG